MSEEPTPRFRFRGLVSSSQRWFGHSTIYRRAGEHEPPYMTRLWIGRLRLHIFHRGDNDPDPHDHPWGFWTFPLVAYIEEVHYPIFDDVMTEQGPTQRFLGYEVHLNLVPAFRWSYRPATHLHRVLCVNGDNPYDPTSGRKIVTFVWREKESRKWGFLKSRDGRWCWVYWKDYVFNGGKDAPCQ